MGDKYEWTDMCPKCRTELEVYYAPSCGLAFEKVTCKKCKTTFEIVMEFSLKEVKEDGEH